MSPLRHDARPYANSDGFVSVAAPLVHAALERNARPVILHDFEQISYVRDAVGADDEIVGVDMTVIGRNPARVLPVLQKLLDEHPARELCCVAEPIRAATDDALAREAALNDLMLCLPGFTSWRASMTCTYDADKLAPEITTSIRSRHASGSDPVEEVARARSQPLPTRPADCAELGVDRTTLGALRGFVQQRAERAGLDDERVEDLVYAVNEVVTNSLCHGEGRARVSFWTEASAVVCEVRDRGWIRDPLVGRVAPDPDHPSGRGLWLVNQLCDLVQLRSSPAGTTVRMFVEPAG